MSDSNSLQLDSLETTGTFRPPTTYRSYCRNHCSAELDATRQAYECFDTPHSTRRLEAFDSCRTGAWFARNVQTGKVRVLSHSCHLRWCPMCSATRRWFLTQQVTEWLSVARKPKFLTLTLSHTSAPLDSQLTHLYDCFRKIRRNRLLKKSISGGVWFFQIKKSDNDKLWHPHLHCVIDSEFIDKYELSKAWAQVTYSSRIVDIKVVGDLDGMAEYVARYAARPSLLSSLSTGDRLELVESLHGRRLVGTWGNARSIVLRPSKPPDADDWKDIGSWSLVHNLISSDPSALQIWRAYLEDKPIPEDCTLCGYQDFINNTPEYTPRTVEENYKRLLLFNFNRQY